MEEALNMLRARQMQESQNSGDTPGSNSGGSQLDVFSSVRFHWLLQHIFSVIRLFLFDNVVLGISIHRIGGWFQHTSPSVSGFSIK